jgi:hypothetical protein
VTAEILYQRMDRFNARFACESRIRSRSHSRVTRFTLESRKIYRWLFSEKREQEISDHFRDGTTEKEFGGETYNTEGHDNHEQKKNHSAEFCHQVDRPSLGDGDDVSTAEWYAPARK